MGSIISLSRDHSAQGEISNRLLTDFWLLVESQLRHELARQENILKVRGYKPQVVEEAAPDRGGDHITLFFRGTQALESFFFAVTLRDHEDRLRVEARVLPLDLSAVYERIIAETAYHNYNLLWLQRCVETALADLTDTAPLRADFA